MKVELFYSQLVLIRGNVVTYALLNNHYSKTAKTVLKQKSVLVSLLPGEDNGNYLVRVE